MSAAVYYGVFLSAVAVLFALDLRTPDFRGLSFGGTPNARRNRTYFVAALVTVTLLRWMNDALYPVVPKLDLFGGIPFGAEVVALFLFAEFANWVVHWIKHESPALWRLHIQHHREDHYNIWLTSHTHPLEVLIFGFLINASVVGLGFGKDAAQVYFLFYSLANTYQHSSRDLSLGWLDAVIVSPRYHRLHHARDLHCNYGSTLTVWDVIFRTARWPAREDPLYANIGIEDADAPFGFWEELAYPLPGRGPRPPAAEPAARADAAGTP